uniref:WWE domain-containing protein n=1 Tax=Gasterosteus aculeatus aculeatus TaxID=481459 RepID=A0AAQ4PWT3_GASAC
MLLASAVLVWEWLNEHGRWRPYSPAVCHHIEAVIRSDPRCGSVVLGQVDSRLSPYIIDLHSMHQFRQDTAFVEFVFQIPAEAELGGGGQGGCPSLNRRQGGGGGERRKGEGWGRISGV